MRPSLVFAVLAAAGLVLGACSDGHAAPSLTSHRVGHGLSGVGDLPTAASAWPEAGHDARFSSATGATGPQHATVRWQARLPGDATPGPVLAPDGSVIAATQGGFLYDLDSRTGATRWRFDGKGSYGSDLSTSPAVLPDGVILWPGPHDTLFALDAHGHLIWKHTLRAQVLSPAVAGRHRVYVADLEGTLLALDVSAAVPRVAWSTQVGAPDYASPSVGQDGTIYTADDKSLVAVRDLGSRAAIRWRLRTNALVEVSNAVTPRGDVVLGTNHDREYGVTPAGRVAWALDVGDNTYSSSVATPQGRAYFGDNTGRLRVVDARNGHVEHLVTPLGDGKEKIWTSAAVDDRGDFYWGTTAGHVYGYDRNGKQLFHLTADGSIDSYPAIGGDGTLYVATTNGSLYAIGA